MRFTWDHADTTNLLFNSNYGLLVTSFEGAIEIFDESKLNLSIWNNN